MSKQKTTNLLRKSLAGVATLAMVLTLVNVSPAVAKNGADDTGADDNGGAKKSSSSKSSNSSSSKSEDNGRNKPEDGGVHQNRNRGASTTAPEDNPDRLNTAGEDNPNRLNDDNGAQAEAAEVEQEHGVEVENEATDDNGADDIAEIEVADQELGDDNGQNDANDDNQTGFLGTLKNKVLAFFGGLFN